MSIKSFVCALIAAVTVAIPLLAILVIHRKGMRKVINRLFFFNDTATPEIYTQQFIF